MTVSSVGSLPAAIYHLAQTQCHELLWNSLLRLSTLRAIRRRAAAANVAPGLKLAACSPQRPHVTLDAKLLEHRPHGRGRGKCADSESNREPTD